MGIATTAVLIMSNITVSLIRRVVRPEVRIPVFVVVIASFVTIVELLMKAYFYELHKVLGIFIALIVVNCTILGRAEAFASKNPVAASALDGLSIGVGSTAALVVLGGLRELVGQGTLFAQAHLMLGDWARVLELEVGEGFHGALAAILPPGAFIGLGFLIALKERHRQARGPQGRGRARRHATAHRGRLRHSPWFDTPLRGYSPRSEIASVRPE